MGWWDAAEITLDMVKGPSLSRVLHRFSLRGETSLVKIVSSSVFKL